MLAESTDAQALEKSVIAGFNSQLVARVSQLKTNHSDVSGPFLPWRTYALIPKFQGEHMVLGLKLRFHSRPGQPDGVRLH